MAHLIYIYLIIGSFIAGYHLADFKEESWSYKLIAFLFFSFFGGIILLFLIINLIKINRNKKWTKQEDTNLKCLNLKREIKHKKANKTSYYDDK
jgi:cellulose synthase/poly-beta-1,6-N-acetylglucosamine synthase-like glycosyltransferase